MEASSYMVSYAHPHPPGEQWICTTPGIQKSATVVSHHVSYTYNWGNTKYLFMKLSLKWSHTLTHIHQESSGYVQHQASKNHQLWFPIMFHTHTTRETPNIYLWKILINGLIRSPTPTRRAVDMYNTKHPKITNCGFPSCAIYIQVGEHKKAIYEASHNDFQVSILLTALGGSEVIICAC